MGQVVGHRFPAGWDADGQQPPELLGRERPQIAHLDHRSELPAEKEGDDHHPDEPGEVAGHRRPQHPQGGNGPQAVDEDGVAPDVQAVHQHRYEHGLLHHLAAAEKGGEGEVDRLEHHPHPDDPHIAAGFLENLLMDPHEPENAAATEDQDQTHQKPEHDVGHQGHCIGPVDLGGVLGADVLGNQDHGGGTHHGEYQKHQICHLIGVADGPHSSGIPPAHHDLVGIAYQHLEEQLNKNRPAQGQNIVFPLLHVGTLSPKKHIGKL